MKLGGGLLKGLISEHQSYTALIIFDDIHDNPHFRDLGRKRQIQGIEQL